MAHLTKDEKFIVTLYQLALPTGDVHTTVNRYQAGDLIGLHPKAVDTICKLLLQANFIKKGPLDDVYITPNGLQLIQQLLKQQ
jgi:hypothetical protein